MPAFNRSRSCQQQLVTCWVLGLQPCIARPWVSVLCWSCRLHDPVQCCTPSLLALGCTEARWTAAPFYCNGDAYHRQAEVCSLCACPTSDTWRCNVASQYHSCICMIMLRAQKLGWLQTQDCRCHASSSAPTRGHNIHTKSGCNLGGIG
jgi:hypothetical protein